MNKSRSSAILLSIGVQCRFDKQAAIRCTVKVLNYSDVVMGRSIISLSDGLPPEHIGVCGRFKQCEPMVEPALEHRQRPPRLPRRDQYLNLKEDAASTIRVNSNVHVIMDLKQTEFDWKVLLIVTNQQKKQTLYFLVQIRVRYCFLAQTTYNLDS